MKKIAVMLPIGYRGGSLRAAKALAKGIALGGRQQGEDLQVVFSYVAEGGYDLHSDFDDLKEMDISLRETVWMTYSLAQLRASIPLLEIEPSSLTSGMYCLPSDGANDFFDCDAWLIISDRLTAPLFPIRKYACVVYDYIQRYVPEIFNDHNLVWDRQEQAYFSLVRNAARVFVTTPSTRADLISYAGIPGSRVTLLDMDFEIPDQVVPSAVRLDLPENYFVWSTNTAQHKNHLTAFQALSQYYRDHGGGLEVVITGPYTEYFDVERTFPAGDPLLELPYVKSCRNAILKSETLQEHLRALGNLSEAGYASVLRQAGFLWNPSLYDNGTFSAIEAACYRRPTLSARYPAMQYMDEKFNLNLSYFDPHSVSGMAAALARMEKECAQIPMPDPADLLRHGWRSNAAGLYRSIRELL